MFLATSLPPSGVSLHKFIVGRGAVSHCDMRETDADGFTSTHVTKPVIHENTRRAHTTEAHNKTDTVEAHNKTDTDNSHCRGSQ